MHNVRPTLESIIKLIGCYNCFSNRNKANIETKIKCIPKSLSNNKTNNIIKCYTL